MGAQPVYLPKLNSSDLKGFLDSFDHVFSDCDGVIWAKTPLPGSGEFFDAMERLGKSVHFVSNNSMRSKENYEAQFVAANIKNGFDRLTIPSIAIAEYLKSMNFDKKVYCISCPDAVRILELNGFECKEGKFFAIRAAGTLLPKPLGDYNYNRTLQPELCPDYYGDYAQFLEDDTDVGAVVIDSDFKVNIPKLYQSIAYLKRPEVLFLVGATDKYVPLRPKCLAPFGPGVFIDLVIKESGREPICLGKPGKLFGEHAMKRAGYTDPSRILFIGDMIEQDVGLGKATGFKTLLVLTNNGEEDMLAHKTLRPDFFAPSLGSLVSVFKGLV